MSTVGTILVTLLVVSLVVVAVFLLLYTVYGIVANDVARRLRVHADHLHTQDPLHSAPPGIRYAADLIERWGKR